MSYIIKINQDNDGRRLDRTLRSLFKWVTLGEIMKAIRKGDVRINSKRVREPGTHLNTGDELSVIWPLNNNNSDKESRVFRHSSWGKIKILFQGDNVLILDKPSCMLVQPDEPGGDSVISRVWGVLGTKTPAAVHRLDRNTTGVLAVALHGDSLRAMEELFKQRLIRKFYLAIVTGRAPDNVLIDAPLVKDPDNNLVRVDDNAGVKAMTKCEFIAGDKNFSLVKLELLTGRTHQARVHMAYIKHPILGDRKYGSFSANRENKNITRPLLHAWQLEFPEKVNDSLSEIAGRKFTAPIPEDMKIFIQARGWEVDL